MDQKRLGTRIKYGLLGTTSGLLRFMREPYYAHFEGIIPDDFKGKHVHDLGCGDGRTSLRLKVYLEATGITAYECEPRLVEAARKRGVDARQIDLGKEMPQGELAVLWGVLHHLTDKETVLRRIAERFDLVIINEPVKAWWSFLDGGEPLKAEEWIRLFDRVLGKEKYKIHPWRDEVFVFWRKRAAP